MFTWECKLVCKISPLITVDRCFIRSLCTCCPWSAICTRSIRRSDSRTWLMCLFDCFTLLPFDQVKYKLNRSICLLYGLQKVQIFLYGLQKVQFFSTGYRTFNSSLRATEGSILLYGLQKVQIFLNGPQKVQIFLYGSQKVKNFLYWLQKGQ